MSLTAWELQTSRETELTSTSASITLKFIALHSTDPDAVNACVRLVAPLTYDGLFRQSVKCVPVGGGVWMGDVVYSYTALSDQPEDDPTSDVLGPEYSFDTSAQQVHITQSIATIASIAAGGGAAPNYQKAIGVTRDSVAGCDVFAPHQEWSKTVQYPPPFVTKEWLRAISFVVGTTNNSNFYGYPTGCLLYLGCSGQRKSTEVWNVTHKFAVDYGQNNVVISPSITLTVKPPWSYIWCTYEDSVNANILVQTPAAVYVEQVYLKGDFTILGI